MRALFNYSILLSAIVSIFASSAFAGITVPAERPSSFQSQSFHVNVTVDHENHIYEDGDLMKVTVESSKTGFLYLFYKDAKGNVTLLFPNKFHKDNRIIAFTKMDFPNEKMNFNLETMAPFGKEALQAIVTLTPVDWERVMNAEENKYLEAMPAELKTKIGSEKKERKELSFSGNSFSECTIEITTVPKRQASETKKKRIFVGICVARYADSHIPVLSACEKDILTIGNFFYSNSAVNSLDSRILVNESVTKENIRDLFFNYLPSHTNPGDEIIFYWTGHGFYCRDMNGDEKDGFDETLMLYDSQINDPSTQLIDDEFGRWVQNLAGRKTLFIFDIGGYGGNRNGASSEKDESDLGFGFSECSTIKKMGVANIAIMDACTVNEYSFVHNEKKMSAMTYFLVSNLKKKTPIDQKQLFSKTRVQVKKYVKTILSTDQNMVFQDDFDSPMILNP